MTMKIRHAGSIDELTRIAAAELFEAMREGAHALDDQLTEQGLDNNAFILILLGRIANMATEYAAYMSAGLYSTTHSDETAREGVKMLLRDQKAAAQAGLDRALSISAVLKNDINEAEEAVLALLKRASKSCH